MNLARFDPERVLTWMIVAREEKKPRHPGRHTPSTVPQTPHLFLPRVEAHRGLSRPGSSPENPRLALVRIACRTGGHVKPDVTAGAAEAAIDDDEGASHIAPRCLIVCIFDISGEDLW